MKNFEEQWQQRINEQEKNSSIKMDEDKIWNKISDSLPEEKHQKFAWLTHIAAMIVGVLIAGTIAAFLFKNHSKTNPPQTQYITQKEIDTVYMENETAATQVQNANESTATKTLTKVEEKHATQKNKMNQNDAKNIAKNNDTKQQNQQPLMDKKEESPQEIAVQNTPINNSPKEAPKQKIVAHHDKVIHIDDIINTQQFVQRKTLVDKLLRETKDFENTNPIAFLK